MANPRPRGAPTRSRKGVMLLITIKSRSPHQDGTRPSHTVFYMHTFMESVVQNIESTEISEYPQGFQHSELLRYSNIPSRKKICRERESRSTICVRVGLQRVKPPATPNVLDSLMRIVLTEVERQGRLNAQELSTIKVPSR